APIPIAEQPTLIFVGGLFLAALGVTFAGTIGLKEGYYSGTESYFLWIAVGCMAGCGLIGFLVSYSLPLLGEQAQSSEPRGKSGLRHLRGLLASRKIPVWVLGVFWLVLAGCLLGIRLHLNHRLSLATRMAAFWRNSHVSNG